MLTGKTLKSGMLRSGITRSGLVGGGEGEIPVGGDASVLFSGTGLLSANAGLTLPASASFSGFGNIVLARATVGLSGAVQFDGVGAMTADATVSGAGVALPSSTVFNLDATDTDSYDNSTDLQLWKNTISSPSDGTTQSANDFTLGATSGSSTDDPTFNGTAGDSAAYWSTDGADHFQILTPTSFMNGIQRSDTGDATICIAFRLANLSSLQRLMANANISSSHRGFSIDVETDGSVEYERRNADGTLTTDEILPSGSISANTDYLMIFEIDKTSGEYNVYLNSKTAETTSITSKTITADSNNDLYLMRHPSSTTASVNSGGRYYAVSMMDSTVSSGDVDDIFDYYNEQHNRTYA